MWKMYAVGVLGTLGQGCFAQCQAPGHLRTVGPEPCPFHTLLGSYPPAPQPLNVYTHHEVWSTHVLRLEVKGKFGFKSGAMNWTSIHCMKLAWEAQRWRCADSSKGREITSFQQHTQETGGGQARTWQPRNQSRCMRSKKCLIYRMGQCDGHAFTFMVALFLWWYYFAIYRTDNNLFF